MKHTLHLYGCTPTPLAHYLKALAVLRLVAEQRDATATGRWEGEHFVLESSLDEAGLLAFFLDEYRPTPIVAPWNGGSGFFPKDNCKALEALSAGESARFDEYREALDLGRAVVAGADLTESPKGDDKLALLARVRAEATESLLAWLDAAVLLTSGDVRYPPLLGTGGNDGRLDFTNNFMQRVTEIFDVKSGIASTASRDWLADALLSQARPGLLTRAVGQFSPGAAGGPNAGSGFEGNAQVNPWDFVLMLEGALLFAAAATRKLQQNDYGSLSYPFTVRPSSAGSGGSAHSDEAAARGEIWMPLWQRPVGLAELASLLAEGRANLGRRAARDGFEFARALAELGVDRGIDAFQRYGFVMRSGKAYLATPMGRVAVRRNPDAELIHDLERGGFLDNLRRFVRSKEAPGQIRSLTRQLENALFQLTRGSSPALLQRILGLLGDIQSTAGKSPKTREALRSPLPRLAERWVHAADDGGHEFRIALALAGLHGGDMPMRAHFAPLATGAKWDHWHAESRLAVWGEGELCAQLAQVLERRLLEATQRELGDKPLQYRFAASAAEIAAFLDRRCDDGKIAALLKGLALANIPHSLRGDGADDPASLPAAYAVLKPLFVPNEWLRRSGALAEDARLPLPGQLIARLTSGRAAEAVDIAWRRLSIAGIPRARHPAAAPAVFDSDGLRLLAALMIPLRHRDLREHLQQLRAAEPRAETTHAE